MCMHSQAHQQSRQAHLADDVCLQHVGHVEAGRQLLGHGGLPWRHRGSSIGAQCQPSPACVQGLAESMPM